MPDYEPHALRHELGGGDDVRLSVQSKGTQLNRQRTINAFSGLSAAESQTNRRIDIGFDSTATPTLTGLILSGLTASSFIYSSATKAIVSTAAPTNGQVLIGSTGAVPVAAALTGTANQVTVTNGAGSITLSLPQNIHTGASPTFVNLSLTGLTANAFLYSATGGTITSTLAATNGQVLIGSTGLVPVAAALTGTANQVTITNGAGSITLAAPQDLGTGANFQISSLGVGVAASGTAGRLTVNENLIVSGTGPHAFGGTANTRFELYLTGGYTATGGSNLIKFLVDGTLTQGSAAVDVDYVFFGSTVSTASTGATSLIAGLYLAALALTVNGSATVNNATSFYINGAPSGATQNYAMWVAAGAVRFDSSLEVRGAAGVGFNGAPTGSGLNVGAASTNNSIWNASQGAGTTTLYIGNASINVTSDRRLKSAILPTGRDATSLLLQMPIVDFEWADPSDTARVNRNSRGLWTGMIAQDIQPIAPWAVNAENPACPLCRSGQQCTMHEGYWRIEYEHLVPLLVKAFQEQQARLSRLEAAMSRGQ